MKKKLVKCGSTRTLKNEEDEKNNKKYLFFPFKVNF